MILPKLRYYKVWAVHTDGISRVFATVLSTNIVAAANELRNSHTFFLFIK